MPAGMPPGMGYLSSRRRSLVYCPQWVLTAIERIHPRARVGWSGRSPRYEGELNPGSFVLVQLYHNRDARRAILPGMWCDIEERWSDRGPIYGSKWDPMQWTPFRVAEIPTEELLSGRFTADHSRLKSHERDNTLYEWIKPIGKRVSDSEDMVEAELSSRLDDISEATADYMLHRAARSDTCGAVATPRKFLTKREKDILAGDYDRSVRKKTGPSPHSPAPMR